MASKQTKMVKDRRGKRSLYEIANWQAECLTVNQITHQQLKSSYDVLVARYFT